MENKTSKAKEFPLGHFGLSRVHYITSTMVSTREIVESDSS